MARFSTYLCSMMTLLALCGNGMAQCPQNPGGPSGLSLIISAERETVVAGSPVFVKTVVTNKANQDFCMWVEAGNVYQADVREASGEAPPETKYGVYHDRRINVGRALGNNDVDLRSLNGSGLYVVYKAHQSLAGSTDINTMYDLDEPETYTIVLSLTDLPAVKSNPITVTVVPAPAGASSEAAEQPPTSVPFSLNIRLGYKVTAGMPVDVLVITKNDSSHSIVLRRQEHPQSTGLLGSVFRVDARDSQGNPLPATAVGVSTHQRAVSAPDPTAIAVARAAGTLVSLKPGQDWRNTIRVSDLYDLSKPGPYTIQVRRWDDETKTWVKSNKITVTVTP